MLLPKPGPFSVKKICLVISGMVAAYVLLTGMTLGVPLRVDLLLFVVLLLVSNIVLWWLVSSSQKDAKNYTFPPHLQLQTPTPEHLFGSTDDAKRVAAMIALKRPPKTSEEATFRVIWLSRRHGEWLVRALLLPALIEFLLLVAASLYVYIAVWLGFHPAKTLSPYQIKGAESAANYFSEYPLGVPFLLLGVMGVIGVSTWIRSYLPWRYKFVVLTASNALQVTQALQVTVAPWYLSSMLDTRVVPVDLFRSDISTWSKTRFQKLLKLNVGTVGIDVPGNLDKSLNKLEDVPHPERLGLLIEQGRAEAARSSGMTKQLPRIGE